MDVTLQRLLQLVSPSFQRWVETGNCFQIANFYWLLNRKVAKQQVARRMLHCTMPKEILTFCRHTIKYN